MFAPRSWRSIPAILLLLSPTVATAQNAPAPQGPPPDCSAPEYRQFDFWIGEWDVTIKGQQVGENRITSEEKGCLIHENWRDSRGGTGQSFNFYDRADRKWHQVWVSSTGSVLDLAGEYRDGKLAYKGETKQPNGTVVLHELTFSQNPDGTVRQHWQTSADGGKTWTVGWDGLYTRRAAAR